MKNARPIYVKLLLVTIVLYIISATFIMADLYYKVGEIEHILAHMDKGHVCHK